MQAKEEHAQRELEIEVIRNKTPALGEKRTVHAKSARPRPEPAPVATITLQPLLPDPQSTAIRKNKYLQ